MKLIIYYENLKQELEVDTNEMWSCLKLTTNKKLSEKQREKMIQDKVNKEWNRDEYNNWHRFSRNRGTDMNNDLIVKNKEIIDDMDLFPNLNLFNSYEKEHEYIETCKKIRKILKGYNDWADIVIAIALDGYSVIDYAKEVNSTRKAISKKYNKALKLLKKFYK